MPELSVDTKELFEAAEEMKKLLYQCDSVTQKLDQVISCFHYQINSDGYDREVNGLITQSTNLKSTRENLASAANTLQQIAESYEQVAAPQSFWAEWKENCEKKFPTSIRNKAIGSIALCSFLREICSKRIIPMADIFSCIVKGISKITRTTFFHMGMTVIQLPGLISRWRHSGIGKYLVCGVETAEVTDFSNNHGTHVITDSRNRKNWRVNLIHNRFYFDFYFVNLRS